MYHNLRKGTKQKKIATSDGHWSTVNIHKNKINIFDFLVISLLTIKLQRHRELCDTEKHDD